MRLKYPVLSCNTDKTKDFGCPLKCHTRGIQICRRRGPGQKNKRLLSADDAMDLTPTKKNNHLCKEKSALTKEIFTLAKKPKVSPRSSNCSNFEVSLQSDVEPAGVVVPVVYKTIKFLKSKNFCVFFCVFA